MLTHTEIGRRIELRRKELGLTLTDVASGVGVAASTIQRYEKGRFDKIKMPVIEAIAVALHVNPEWLIGTTTDPVGYDDGDLATLTQKERQIVERFPRLNDEGKARVAEYMDDLITGGRYAPDRDEIAQKTYRIAARSGNNVIAMSDEEKDRFVRSTKEASKKPLPDDLI